ncbi:hypothetical protein [Diaphorobacter aerolatus]|uniref:Lipoprotein n=1 Tax=Diaphorobacter aerolatus TaxID=1288495 RepID=A0A7H0GIP2_9BURK|nr:hypothetical protein [Diaphorobacter aerolatus]QNP48158.1 hypothetical protein H9K75_19300 [Diaphorobacter aerolatus]
MDLNNGKHASWKTCVAACAVLAGLSACDSKNSQEGKTGAPPPASAPATGDVAIGPVVTPSAPAAAPAPPPPSMAEQVHAYVGEPGEPVLSTLQPFLGKYPQDGTNFLKEGILAQRLKKLLGAQYDTLMNNLETVGPLKKEGGRWSVVGNRQHAGGKEAAAVVIDPGRNGLRVWLLSGGKESVFTDLGEEHVIPWTPEVKKFMANAQVVPK